MMMTMHILFANSVRPLLLVWQSHSGAVGRMYLVTVTVLEVNDIEEGEQRISS
jgi:hypothetical protein